MADVVAKYGVDLQDGVSGPAKAAGAELAQLRSKILADTGALRQMQGAMRAMQQSTSVDVQAFKQLKDSIEAHKVSIATSHANYVKLGGDFQKVATAAHAIEPAARSSAASLTAMLKSSDDLTGSLGAAGKPIGKLVETLGETGLAGVAVAAALAVVALGAALVALTVTGLVSLAKQALASGDALRDLNVDLEAAAIGAKNLKASGAELTASVAAVAAKVPIAREQVAGFAHDLAGIKGDAFEQALQAVSTLGSVGGDTGKLVAQLNAAAKAGKSLNTITDKIQAQYGDLANRKMLDLNVQFAKAKEDIAALFSGIKIEGFEKALHSILSLFSQSTASGRALKTLLESVLNPLFGTSAKAGPALVALFKQGIIYALKFGIAVYTVRNKVADLLGIKHDDALMTSLKGLATIAGSLASSFLTLVPGGNAAVSIFTLLKGAVFALTGGFKGVVSGAKSIATGLLGAIGKAVSGLAGKVGAFLGIGKDFVLGIIKGVASGGAALIASVTGLGSKAVSALKGILHISSPSKVLKDQVGVHIAGGVAEGVKAGTPAVEHAARGLGSAAVGASPGGASAPVVPAGAGRGGGGVVFNLTVAAPPGTSNPQAFGAAAGAAIRRELESTLERAAAQLGAA